MSAHSVVAGVAAAQPARRIPLTPAQRGIYVTHSLASDTPVYHVPIALRVRGALNVDALQRAVDALVHRHQALRTTFEEVDGEPVQVVHPPRAAPRVTVQKSIVDGGVRAASAETQRRASAPFDLARGPLWRLDSVTIGPDDHALILVFHHIVIDEVSAGVVAREFRLAYAAAIAGSPGLPDPDPGREYVDFCAAQQEWADEEGVEFWRQQVRGIAARVLPQERAASEALFGGERIRFTIEDSTLELLNAFCVAQRVTPFMVFHAILAMLLSGWTGETEVAIGSPMTGRVNGRFAQTVGYFQNTVVLPARISADQTFAGVLSQSRRTVLSALHYQGTPFESVVEAVRPARDATRNPLFQAALVYNRVRLEDEWALQGLRVEALPFEWPVAQFDLTLTLVQEAGGLRGDFTYDTNRFFRDTVLALATTFLRMLPILLADAGVSVAQAPTPPRLVPALARPLTPAPSHGGAREEILRGLFSEVLGVLDVGINDDFFDLGGHSLLAGRLVSRARTVLGAAISLRDLFEAPTVAGLLGRMRRGEPECPLPSRALRPGRVPLSYSQRGLWFLHHLEGGRPTYNVPLVLRFAAGLDPNALREALGDVLARHESLRTVFVEVGGEACQVVLDPADVDLPMLDIAAADLDRQLREKARHSFDLASQIPVRAWLFALPDGDHVLLLLLHHIASDAWSLGPLGRDLSVAYAARTAGRSPNWPALPAHYAEYALWQRERLGEPDDPASLAARQLAHWREELADLPGEIDLPVDRLRPPIASYRGATVDVDWDADLHRALTDLARETNTTLFMVLQAGLAALLSRLGAGSDIPIGAPSGERGHEAFHDLIGYFVNTLVLRTDVAGDPTFRELVARVRRTDLAAFSSQDVPFDQVVEAVNPGRSLSRHPLFQVMLTLYRDIVADLRLPGVTTTVGRQTHTGVSKFDLSFNLQEFYRGDGTPAGVRGVVEYATDLFDASTVDKILSRLVRLLRWVVADPDRRVGAVDLLEPDELHRMLVEWSGSAHEVPPGRLPDLFERQAARTPHAIAVTCGTVSISYQALNSRANQLGRLLIASGVGPERYVAVALPRSVDLVVALLAVLKAGGAYAPIELDQPQNRLARIISDIDPVLILTHPDVAASLPAGHGRPLLVGTAAPAGYPTRDITDAERIAPVNLANAAYAIVTSGSTGAPKGVVVEHRSLALYLAYAAHSYPGVSGAALVHSPVTFDLTVTGLFAPLTVGGQVCLGGLDNELDGVGTAPPAGVSFVKLTPSHLPMLASLPAVLAPNGQLVVGGEVLLGDAVRAWRHAHPQSTVVNEYGPTETTVGCATFALQPGDLTPGAAVPIGRPIWNTRIYVLDSDLRPVAAGVRGELHVAGGLVSRGYLHRSGLTAQRYLPDLFGLPGDRMYRTGDIGRWNGQGQLEFLGRTDNQVKVRGVRVELGEIEAALLTHEAIAQVAVVAHTAAAGDRRLVAYVVPAASRVDDDDLRRHLASRLPRHMLPSAFVSLPALPLSSNGKVDRQALPAPDPDARPRGRQPRTPTEHTLSRLFADVLGLDHVDVDENFFDLGGHSLLAVRLVARIRQELGRGVPVWMLIARPTVAALAADVDASPPGGRSSGAVRLKDGGGVGVTSPASATTVALIHPVGGTLFCYQPLVRDLPGGNAVVGCERLPGDHPPEESLWDVADRHVDALRAAVPEGAFVLAGWSVGGVLAHAVAARLLGAGRQVAGVALLDSLAIRTPDDRADVRAGGARLLALARAVRQDGHGVVTEPSVARLLEEYGLDVHRLKQTPVDEIAEMMADWARLLVLLAAHEPVPVSVTCQLFVASGNPRDLPQRITESWSGLCGDLVVQPVPGDHLTILRPPALTVVSASLVSTTVTKVRRA